MTTKIAEQHPDAGDVWTWTAIDADSKLVLSWLVAGRDAGSAYTFMQDVASRLKHRVQMTTGAHTPCLSAEDSFGGDIDYATLTKIYTMRMHVRRFTRLTNALSKKVEMQWYAVALHFMPYNFVRIHKTLKVTPAMAAGVTRKLWEIADVVALLPDED